MEYKEHKYIQPFQYPLNGSTLSGKTATIESLSTYVTNNKDNFKNGEELTIKFTDENGKVTSAIAVVNKTINGNISISVSISENETMKIVESETPPSDDNVLWMKESEETPTQRLEAEYKALNAAVQGILTILARHEFAFDTIMECGDLETNNTRTSLMNAAAPIKPDILDTGDTILTTVEYNDAAEEEEPNYENYETPNIRSLCIKGAATEAIIKANVKNINLKELILCESNYALYTVLLKNNVKTLIKISGSGGGTDTGSTEEIMEGITQRNSCIESIKFISSKNNKYIVKVNDDGELICYDANIDEKHSAPEGEVGTYSTSIFEKKLYINSIYCGGTDVENEGTIDEHSLNYCSHNFVELSNLTGKDVNLSGLTLQYGVNGTYGTDWKVLKLRGIIKNGGTFLIRGAQCSVMNANTTLIKVDTYDMEWNVEKTVDGKTVSEPIQFSNKACKFYLTYGDGGCVKANPYLKDTDNTIKVYYGYSDLIGMTNGGSDIYIDAAESKANNTLSSSRIMTKYYTMDPVKQATKDIDKRNNLNDIQFVELSKTGIIPNVLDYKPKASYEGKNIFFNKTKLKEDIPSIVTCSFGIQATDNGSGATRCFNWVSKGNYEEGIWIYDSSNTLVHSGISIDGEEKTKKIGTKTVINPRYYYNRIHQEATDGEFFTVHKYIVKNLSTGTYKYKVGRYKKNGTTIEPIEGHITELKQFIVRSDSEVNANGFKFVQTSDQQGFNWDEYQLWKYAARDVSKNSGVEFMVNTGDMTQNGNRISEWIDYFDAKDSFIGIEEMATIGNNDLCPEDVYTLGDGEDTSKLNPANILLYYTFEIDENNLPVFNVTIEGQTTTDIYVPSLYSFNYGKAHFICVNSEITQKTEQEVFKIKGADSTHYGYLYAKIEEWCANDIALYGLSGTTKATEWQIAYCHESPFTIMTDALMTGTSGFYDAQKGLENTEVYRGGSHLNTVAIDNNSTIYKKYWFSKFCQDNNIRLVIGGHKHTQATTWPLRENFVYNTGGTITSCISFKPTIEVTMDDLRNHFGCTDTAKTEENILITVSGEWERGTGGHMFYLRGYKYPYIWFTKDTEQRDIIKSEYINRAHFCTFEVVDKVTAPVYAMSQSTGYKHTSNKELPGYVIPWERYFYPNDSEGTANAGQKYPFYTVWNITFGTGGTIVGTVKKVAGLFNSSGKFNINTQGEKAKNNKSNDDTWGGTGSSPIAINGITKGQDEIDSTVIKGEIYGIITKGGNLPSPSKDFEDKVYMELKEGISEVNWLESTTGNILHKCISETISGTTSYSWKVLKAGDKFGTGTNSVYVKKVNDTKGYYVQCKGETWDIDTNVKTNIKVGTKIPKNESDWLKIEIKK